MKYYKYLYWKGLNSNKKIVRAYADYRWRKAVRDYTQHYLKLQKKLPSEFVKVLDDTSYFHDANLKCIFHDIMRNKVVLLLSGNSYKIKMITFNSKLSWKCKPVTQTLSIGYCEVEKHNRFIVWRILFDNGNELTLEFSRINIISESI